MKAVLYLLISLAVFHGGSSVAQSVTGKVQQVDPVAGTLSVDGPNGTFYNFRVDAMTDITVNGNPGTLKDLQVGASVTVTRGELDTASAIAAEGGGNEHDPAPARCSLTVPATANAGAPVSVGTVTAGETVTVTPQKVWWCGGGSMHGVFTNWRGYDSGRKTGIPWMALVAAVGDARHWAKDNTLSFVAPADGLLVLYANDGKPADNIGEGIVIVTVTPK